MDAFCLRLFTKIAHAVQAATDITCYRLAEQSFVVSCIGAALTVAGYWVPLLQFDEDGTWLFTAIIYGILTFLSAHEALEAAHCDEQWSEREIVPAVAIFYHFRPRTLLTAICLFDLGADVLLWLVGSPLRLYLGTYTTSAWLWGNTIGGYLMAVVPMPKQRLRKLVPIKDAT